MSQANYCLIVPLGQRATAGEAYNDLLEASYNNCEDGMFYASWKRPGSNVGPGGTKPTMIHPDGGPAPACSRSHGWPLHYWGPDLVDRDRGSERIRVF